MKRILFLIILGWTVLQGLKAQTDAALSHYFMATAYYNPAAAGSTEDLKMLALFNRQWVGFPNAQQSFFVTADMPLKIGKTNHGIGIAAYTESIGLFQKTIRRCIERRIANRLRNGIIQSRQYLYSSKPFSPARRRSLPERNGQRNGT